MQKHFLLVLKQLQHGDILSLMLQLLEHEKNVLLHAVVLSARLVAIVPNIILFFFYFFISHFLLHEGVVVVRLFTAEHSQRREGDRKEKTNLRGLRRVRARKR